MQEKGRRKKERQISMRNQKEGGVECNSLVMYEAATGEELGSGRKHGD